MLARILIAAALCAAAPLSARGAEPGRYSQEHMNAVALGRTLCLGEFRVQGTHRTRDHIVLQELLVRPGDSYDATLLEESRLLVQNLGIFSSVQFAFVEGGTEDVYDLIIMVKERWTLLPDAQITRKDSGRSVLGVKLKERNLFGLGQSLDVELSKVGADDFAINLGWQGGITFREPRLFGTYYSFSAEVARRLDFTRVFDGNVIVAEYATRTDGLLLSVGKRFLPRHSVSLAWHARDIEHELHAGGPARADARLSSLSTRYAWNRADLHPWFAVSGFVVEGSFGVHSHALGSDLASESVEGGWRWYKRFGEYGNLRLRAGAAKTLSGDFDMFAQTLGGSGDVRGYADGQFRGMGKWFAGVEARDAFGRPFWRNRLLLGWAAFADVGDVAFRTLDDPGEWKVGAGAGLRLYAHKIVDGVLSVDMAYGFDVHDWKLLVNVGREF